MEYKIIILKNKKISDRIYNKNNIKKIKNPSFRQKQSASRSEYL